MRLLGGPLVSGLARSWSFRTINADRWHQVVASGKPYIFVLWHEAILPLLWHHRQQHIAIIVSQGREGQYLGDYASRLGYQLLQGSSSRGGARAMLGAVRALREGFPVAVTPDGPRGPARSLKPGVIQAAQRGGAVVIPLHAMVNRAWRLGSWDRLIIPKPWARVSVGYGSPFEIGEGQAGIEQGMERCEAAMPQLEAEMIAS